LEWVTRSENEKHKWKDKKQKNYFVINNPSKWKIWDDSLSSMAVLQYNL